MISLTFQFYFPICHLNAYYILFDYVKEENASLIMVTHDNKLANLSKRIIKIKDGKIE